MNAKQAKRLRRIAERETLGMPACSYFVRMRGREGKQSPVRCVHPASTRGRYRALKRAIL